MPIKRVIIIVMALATLAFLFANRHKIRQVKYEMGIFFEEAKDVWTSFKGTIRDTKSGLESLKEKKAKYSGMDEVIGQTK